MIPKYRIYCYEAQEMIVARDYRELAELFAGLDADDSIFSEPMQSTGLFDDSTPKKEIFEGDIVETIYNGELFTGVIVYDQEETGFKATNGRDEYGNNFCYLGGNDSNMVIGNIYQNPELLKEVGNDTEV